ncbi:MAG TPA: GNAT family N-acetyltransferase [Clostridia bacterium]|nr:GNAT family N-acetyltransferase [Clostridia bacterium]
MSGIVIRAAKEEDIPEILEIIKDAFTRYANELKMPERVMALKENEQILADEMKKKRVLVCVTNGIISGTIRYEILPNNIAYISRFGVRADMQKNGVGQALIEAITDECISKNVLAIALHTSSKMKNLIRFYYKHDFYIHSTSFDRGYVRALLIKEMQPVPGLNPELVNIDLFHCS